MAMKSWIKIGLGAAFLLGLAGFGTGLYLLKKGHKDLLKVDPDYKITAIELQKAFEDNETAATEKYVNSIIEVTGTVESVGTGENNATNISLKTSNDLSLIICTFPLEVNSLNISPGSPATVRGECSGYLMDVLLNNCVIIK